MLHVLAARGYNDWTGIVAVVAFGGVDPRCGQVSSR